MSKILLIALTVTVVLCFCYLKHINKTLKFFEKICSVSAGWKMIEENRALYERKKVYFDEKMIIYRFKKGCYTYDLIEIRNKEFSEFLISFFDLDSHTDEIVRMNIIKNYMPEFQQFPKNNDIAYMTVKYSYMNTNGKFSKYIINAIEKFLENLDLYFNSEMYLKNSKSDGSYISWLTSIRTGEEFYN